MAAGHPAVHPTGDNAPAPLQQKGPEGPVAELDFFPEIAGKTRGMILRFVQFIFAGIGASLAALSSEIKNTQLKILFISCILQMICSGAMGIVDMVMLDMKRSLKKKWALGVLVFFDTVVGGFTFFATSATAGLIVYFDQDLKTCNLNDCPVVKLATAAAFVSAFLVGPCNLLNIWSIFYYYRQWRSQTQHAGGAD